MPGTGTIFRVFVSYKSWATYKKNYLLKHYISIIENNNSTNLRIQINPIIIHIKCEWLELLAPLIGPSEWTAHACCKCHPPSKVLILRLSKSLEMGLFTCPSEDAGRGPERQ